MSFYIQKWSLLAVYIIYGVKDKIKVEHLRVNNQLYSTTKEQLLCFKGFGGCRASAAQQESTNSYSSRRKKNRNRMHKQYAVVLEAKLDKYPPGL